MHAQAQHRRQHGRVAILVVALAALALVFLGCASGGDDLGEASDPTREASAAVPRSGGEGMSAPITVDSTVRDVVNHPAFAGFGELVLPLDGAYDEEMPLRDVESLLPYHSNVDPVRAAETLNTMIDRVAAGETVFYDIYSADERAVDPSKDATGLFFFRGDPGAPYAVICAGGGFSYVGSIHESFPHAQALSERGYNAFAIKYRVRGQGDVSQLANEDLAAALAFIDDNAAELEVDRAGYSLWGSSAGGRMVALVGSRGPAAFGRADMPRPSTVVTVYTAHEEYSPNDPPTFAVVGSDDGIAPPAVMRRRIDALRDAGIDAELRVYPNVGHGFGLGYGTSAEGWLDAAADFWDRHR